MSGVSFRLGQPKTRNPLMAETLGLSGYKLCISHKCPGAIIRPKALIIVCGGGPQGKGSEWDRTFLGISRSQTECGDLYSLGAPESGTWVHSAFPL